MQRLAAGLPSRTPKMRERRIERKREVMRQLDLIKLALGCRDCGYNADPIALDFDHLDPTQKVDSICALAKRGSLARVLTEIEKCDVVCANCHRVRTRNRRVDTCDAA